MRRLSITVLSAAILLLPSTADSSSEQRSSATNPGAAFAVQVTELVDHGARLVDLQVAEDSRAIAVTVVLATDTAAERLTLVLANRGDSPRTFTRDRIPMPDRSRVYRRGGDLLAALKKGPVTEVVSGCQELLLVTESAGEDVLEGVPLDPTDYYVVADSAAGTRSAARHSREAIASLHRRGLAVVNVLWHGRSPELLFADENEEVGVYLRTNRGGAVVGYELRVGPPHLIWQRWDADRQAEFVKLIETTRGTLRATRFIPEGHELVDYDWAPVRFQVGDDASTVISDQQFGPGDVECGC